jgi:hypothetical protein
MRQRGWEHHAMVRAMLFLETDGVECAAVRVGGLAVGVAYFTIALS